MCLVTSDVELSDALQCTPTVLKAELLAMLHQATCNEHSADHPNAFNVPQVTPRFGHHLVELTVLHHQQ
jgi:hypothetical protein